MKFLENIFRGLAKLQHRFRYTFLIVIILFTIFMIIGTTKVEMQSDMSKEMPQQLDIYQLNNKITDKFGGQDVIIILFEVDDTSNSRGLLNDIRDPQVIDYLVELENSLSTESSVENVMSIGTYLQYYPHSSVDDVINFIKLVPESEDFFSKDFQKTMMYIQTDVGTSEEKTIAVTELIEDKLSSMSVPPGIKTSVTGTPPLRVMILDLLFSDAIFTIFLSSLLILGLLIIMQRSFTKAIVVFIPLTLGLIWTLGTLGWTGRAISVATVGLGAMILGLGVEYGVFMFTRYMEERLEGKNQLESLKISVPGVGAAISGSGTTTIIGFLALTLSVMPMLQNLGISLAMGIAFSLAAALFAAPVVILIEEDLEHMWIRFNQNRMSKKLKLHRRIGK